MVPMPRVSLFTNNSVECSIDAVRRATSSWMYRMLCADTRSNRYQLCLPSACPGSGLGYWSRGNWNEVSTVSSIGGNAGWSGTSDSNRRINHRYVDSRSVHSFVLLVPGRYVFSSNRRFPFPRDAGREGSFVVSRYAGLPRGFAG